MRRSVPALSCAALALLALTSCSGGGKQENASALASLDTRLTNGAVQDNAVAPARKTQAMEQAAVDPGPAVLAAHQSIMKTDGHVAAGSSEARNTAKGTAVRRLAAANGAVVGGCAGGNLRYGDQWVSAMPEGLGAYPGATLVEAAGADTGRCLLRVASFTTPDSPEAVASHYATSVRRAGFDAERQPCRTEIRLGGVRAADGAAYMLFARRTAKGLTEVDIIASAGPA